MSDITAGYTFGGESFTPSKINQAFAQAKLNVGIIQLVTAVVAPQYAGASSVSTTGDLPSSTTGLEVCTATITPRSNTTKILIAVSFNLVTASGDIAGAPYGIAIFRGSTLIARKIIGENNTDDVPNKYFDASFLHLDEPASASPVTYSVRAYCSVGGGTIAVGINKNAAGHEFLTSPGLFLEMA